MIKVVEPTMIDRALLRMDLHPDCAREIAQTGQSQQTVINHAVEGSCNAGSMYREDGRLVGMVGIHAESDGQYAPWMFITNAVEGRRLSLAKVCKRLMREYNVPMNQLVFDNNTAGLKLFKLLGFVIHPEQDDEGQYYVHRETA